MVSIFLGIKNAVESLYDSKLSIYRNKEEVTPSGAVRDVRQEVATDISCRLSLLSLENTNRQPNADVSQVNYDVKLFTSPEVDIIPGDELHVSQRGSEVQIFRASKHPFEYVSHQEVYIERVDFT